MLHWPVLTQFEVCFSAARDLAANQPLDQTHTVVQLSCTLVHLQKAAFQP